MLELDENKRHARTGALVESVSVSHQIVSGFKLTMTAMPARWRARNGWPAPWACSMRDVP